MLKASWQPAIIYVMNLILLVLLEIFYISDVFYDKYTVLSLNWTHDLRKRVMKAKEKSI